MTQARASCEPSAQITYAMLAPNLAAPGLPAGLDRGGVLGPGGAQKQGLIRQLGVSNVTAGQVAEGIAYLLIPVPRRSGTCAPNVIGAGLALSDANFAELDAIAAA